MRSVTSSNLGASRQPKIKRKRYFIIRGCALPTIGQLAERELLIQFADRTACPCRIPAYIISDALLLQPGAKPVAGAIKAEEHMSQAFKLRTRRRFARH